jgi:hypothetical protein
LLPRIFHHDIDAAIAKFARVISISSGDYLSTSKQEGKTCELIFRPPLKSRGGGKNIFFCTIGRKKQINALN